MSNEAKIYWLTRLDHLQPALITVGILMSVFTISLYFWAFLEAEDDYEFAKKNRKYGIIGIIILFICLFIPSKDEAILITAGGKTMDFIQNDSSINKIPSQTTAIISNFLEKQLAKCDSIK